MNMDNFWKVTKFTVAQQVKGKAFKVSTTIILIAVLILTSLINFIPAFSGKDDDNKEATNGTMNVGIETAYYMDDSDLGIDLEPSIKAVLPNLKFEKATESRASIVEKLQTTEDKTVLVSISNEAVGYYVEVITPTSNTVSSEDGQILAQAVSNVLNSSRLINAGVSQEDLERLSTPINTQVFTAGAQDDTFEDIIIKSVFPMVACMLLFYIIYFYGYWVASSIVAEKTSRVMELLLTSTKPMELVVGKCVGMGFLAITQFASILLTAYISFVGSGAIVKKFIDTSANIFDISAILGRIPVLQLILIILFFILGYVLYAVLNALVGATISKLEDLNTALMPISFISIIAFYLAFAAIMAPESTIGTIATYVPFSAPFYIPSMILSGTLGMAEMGVSLLILISTIVVLTLFTARIYSVVILHTGNRLKIKDLFTIFGNEK
ncbi:ABC transporter permease [Clostridium sp. UBA1056]|uniref:ABC transporter permease n=1 Tax=unclassified Clostridium TaxID=2614128 RepID=UPI003216EBCB